MNKINPAPFCKILYFAKKLLYTLYFHGRDVKFLGRCGVKISVLIFMFVLLFSPQLLLAQGLKDAFGGEGSPLETVKTQAGFEEGENIGVISGRVINVALSLVGLIFLILMVYAGYLWMTARGEEAKIEKAQSIIKGTVIGLILVLSAYAITVLITSGINK